MRLSVYCVCCRRTFSATNTNDKHTTAKTVQINIPGNSGRLHKHTQQATVLWHTNTYAVANSLRCVCCVMIVSVRFFSISFVFSSSLPPLCCSFRFVTVLTTSVLSVAVNVNELYCFEIQCAVLLVRIQYFKIICHFSKWFGIDYFSKLFEFVNRKFPPSTNHVKNVSFENSLCAFASYWKLTKFRLPFRNTNTNTNRIVE